MRCKIGGRCVGGAFPTGMRSDFPGARSPAARSAGGIAALCARHADRLVWRNVRSAPCGPSGGVSAGNASPGARPRVVARDAGQSAQGYARPRAARRTYRRRPRPGPSSAHRRDRFRSPDWARTTPSKRCPIWSAAAAAYTLSGSWAPTICAASTVGSGGGTSPHWCRSQSSIGLVRAFTPPRARPARRWRARASRERPRRLCRNESRRPGFICTASNRRCRRPRCARRGRTPGGAQCEVVPCKRSRLKPLTEPHAYLKAIPDSAIRGLRKWSERIRTPVHTCHFSGRTSRARSGLQNAS